MKTIILSLLLAGAPGMAQAKNAEFRHYRWAPREWSPLPYLFTSVIDTALNGTKREAPPAVVGLGSLAKGQTLRRSKGEMVEQGVQQLGPAKIDGSWTQTVFHPDGHVLFATGSVLDELPKDLWLPRLKKMDESRISASQKAEDSVLEYHLASHRTPPDLRLRLLPSGTWEPYWRFEYVTKNEEQLLFLELGENGELLNQGSVQAPSADGKALVFPRGPNLSALTEVPLYELNGDGTLTGLRLKINSALGLDVNVPNLLFYFAESDRRLDFAQVYFCMEQSFRWMKEKVGAELKSPLSVRLHVGDGGVSNAAFYYQNTVFLGTGDGVIYKDLTRDPSIITHESIHAIIDAYAGLPPDGEGGSFNEGFADFFAAMILQNPRLGESSYLKGPYRRTLENDLKAYRDFTSGVYQNGSVVAGTFWDLRKILSDDKLAMLAFRTLTRLGKGSKFADFVPALLNASSGFLSASEQAAVMASVSNRGWVITQ